MTDLPASFLDLPLDGPLPVDSWNPPNCGDIDIRIARDGTWFHEGAPIFRPALVRLFSRLLRRDTDAYHLVTPVEKLGIVVEDVPFIAVEMAVRGEDLVFRTNVGDLVAAGPAHPLRFDPRHDSFTPYVLVRPGLEARLSRTLARDIAALGVVSGDQFGIWSGGRFFPITPADAIS